jgi:hypothetical protein
VAYSGQSSINLGKQHDTNRQNTNSDVLYLPRDCIERDVQDALRIGNTEGASGVSIITGPPGPKGDRGPPGLPGFHSCECKTTTIDSDYVTSIDDYYIGCINNTPITVILPMQPDRAVELVIKRQTGVATADGTVSVKTADGALIDGQQSHTIRNPFGVLRIVWNSNNWFKT